MFSGTDLISYLWYASPTSILKGCGKGCLAFRHRILFKLSLILDTEHCLNKSCVPLLLEARANVRLFGF